MIAVARPAPDKLAHMLAFGGLAFLFLQARWLRRGWLAGLVVFAWTALDEATQALPGLRRTISAQDMIAGQFGVVVVVTWWWALLPLGGQANRQRLRWQRFVLEDAMRRPSGMSLAVAAAVAGAGGAAVLVAILVRLARVELLDPPSMYVAATFLGGLVAAHVTVVGLARRRAVLLGPEAPCPDCGASCRSESFSDAGSALCPDCGGPVHRGLWRDPMELPLRAVLRGALPAAVATASILGVGVLMFFGLLFVAHAGGIGGALTALWRDLDSDLQLAIDLAAIGTSLAVGVRLYRMRQAVLYDRQHLACRGCGHDLRGVSLKQGCGRCPECGLAFARYADAPTDG